MQRLFFILLSFLFFVSSAWAAPVHIRNFDSAVDIAANGDITVTETLHVDIPATGEFHGIYRDIPLTTRWREQGRTKAEVLSVTVDGRPCPADDVYREGDMIRIYQRDQKHILRPGMHTFTLVYRMSGQTGLFVPNDELTWNVTGSGWEAPVDAASCTVYCPVGAPFYGQAAWLGRTGSKDSEVRMQRSLENERLVMYFQSERAIQPGEQLTVAAGWGKGFITLDPREDKSGLTTIFLLVLAGGLFLFFLILWFFVGRDPKKGIIIARFHAPHTKRGSIDGAEHEMSPAAVGYLWGKLRLSPGCFGAALLSLIDSSCCNVRGNSRDGFLLEPLPSGSSFYAEEEAVHRTMGTESFRVDTEHGERLYDMRNVMQHQLRKDFGDLWKGSHAGGLFSALFGSVWTFWGTVAALLGLTAVVGYACDGILPDGLMVIPVIVFAAGFFLRELLRQAVRIWKRHRYLLCIMITAFSSGMVLLVAGGIGYAFAEDMLVWFSAPQVFLMLAVILIPVGFSCIMDAPSVEARALLDEIEGLALYIGMAERDRMNILNPPDRTLEHYQKLLPYAVALGLEDAWGAYFADVLSAQVQSTQDIQWSPTLAGAFSHQAERSISSYAESQSASSASSFDSGGGAGSGGGGGGGGGC